TSRRGSEVSEYRSEEHSDEESQTEPHCRGCSLAAVMGIDFARVVIRELFYGNKNSDGAVLRVWGKEKQVLFEQTVLPHLDAAYNLARWLTRNEHDAEDMVQ